MENQCLVISTWQSKEACESSSCFLKNGNQTCSLLQIGFELDFWAKKKIWFEEFGGIDKVGNVPMS